MLEIKDLEGKSVLGRLKNPDNAGTPSRWSWLLRVLDVLTFGGITHHCGSICKQVEPATHWHSATYECRKCQARFWTWSDTG